MACTYPSIHFSLDEDTLKITVGCLVCGVVCCVLTVDVFNSPNLRSCSMKTSLANDFAVVRLETKEGPFYYRNISGEEFIFYYSFK